MIESIGFSFFASSVESREIGQESGEGSSVCEKTVCIAHTLFNLNGEVVDLYNEMRNEGFLQRNNVVICQSKAHFKNPGKVVAQEGVRIDCKQIESAGVIEAKSIELTAERVLLVGKSSLVKASQIVINASEVFIDGAAVEGHLTLEGCQRLEVRNLSQELVRAWQEAAPEGCEFIAFFGAEEEGVQGGDSESSEAQTAKAPGQVFAEEVEGSETPETSVEVALTEELEVTEAAESAVETSLAKEASDAEEASIGLALVEDVEVAEGATETSLAKEASDAEEASVGLALVEDVEVAEGATETALAKEASDAEEASVGLALAEIADSKSSADCDEVVVA